jgi:hypothetical protein
MSQPAKRNADVGPNVLDYVYERMSIDGEWSIRGPRDFVWWGKQLAQQVCADPVRESYGYRVVRLHAQADVVRDVEVDDSRLELIDTMNSLASLSALVVDPSSGHIRFHCTSYHHTDNRWLDLFLATAVALQASDANAIADRLAEELGGVVDGSPHPSNGWRTTPDDMLSVRTTMPTQGTVPFLASDFQALAATDAPPWSQAWAAGLALTAKLPFVSSPATPVATGQTTTSSQPKRGSCLIELDATVHHPTLGPGLSARLYLPIRLAEDDARALAAKLNWTESSEWLPFHFLGAWHAPKGGCVFTQFVPALVTGSSAFSGDELRVIFLRNLVFSLAFRARYFSPPADEPATPPASAPATASFPVAVAPDPTDEFLHVLADLSEEQLPALEILLVANVFDWLRSQDSFVGSDEWRASGLQGACIEAVLLLGRGVAGIRNETHSATAENTRKTIVAGARDLAALGADGFNLVTSRCMQRAIDLVRSDCTDIELTAYWKAYDFLLVLGSGASGDPDPALTTGLQNLLPPPTRPASDPRTSLS